MERKLRFADCPAREVFLYKASASLVQFLYIDGLLSSEYSITDASISCCNYFQYIFDQFILRSFKHSIPPKSQDSIMKPFTFLPLIIVGVSSIIQLSLAAAITCTVIGKGNDLSTIILFFCVSHRADLFFNEQVLVVRQRIAATAIACPLGSFLMKEGVTFRHPPSTSEGGECLSLLELYYLHKQRAKALTNWPTMFDTRSHILEGRWKKLLLGFCNLGDK